MDSKTNTGKYAIANLPFYKVFLLFFMLAFILRFFSFFPSLIDHDESTYLVIAKEIIKGKVLYTDVTDIKPVGIFYITAGYIKLFGSSIFGYRVFGTFIIALTSLFLYITKLRIGHSKEAALATGIIYIFFLSIWTQYGVPINTEHFFNLFTALAVLILFSVKANWRLPMAGFVLGMGFLIKIVVAFDFTAIFLFLIISNIINQKISVKKISIYFLSGILFLIPFGLVNLAFYKTGHFSDFYQINYEAFGNYPRQKDFWKALVWVFDFFGRFLPLSVFFFWSLFSKQKPKSLIIREKLFITIWIAFCLVSVLLPGKRFSHYMIQMMLPVSFLAGNIFDKDFRKPAFFQFLFTRKVGYSILGLFIIINVLLQKKDYYDAIDCPRLAADYLRGNIEKDDLIYTGNAQHIIYYLLDVSPPTKYVHPSLLFVKEHYLTLGIDPEKELQTILNKKPKYILTHGEMKNKIIQEALKRDYTLIQTFRECAERVYQLNL
jgi:4-amino-4-deoxy-L-arabinose transferase-like glycosyltransferase